MNWLFLSAALLAAGFVQGLTGFGFGLVSMSLMPLVIGIKPAAAVSTTFTLLATTVTFFRHYREYNWRLGCGFLLSVSVGVPIGVFFLEKTSEAVLLKALGTTMLLFAAREFLLGAETKSIPRPVVMPLGLFSGALSGAFNLGGIPSAAYAYSNPWSRGQIMAFLQVMIMLSCALRIGFYGNFGYFRELSPIWIAAMIAPVYGTIWLGHWVLARVHPKHMRTGVFAFIGAAGVYYLFWH
jgi:uncharacterized membrane protein YfcA